MERIAVLLFLLLLGAGSPAWAELKEPGRFSLDVETLTPELARKAGAVIAYGAGASPVRGDAQTGDVFIFLNAKPVAMAPVGLKGRGQPIWAVGFSADGKQIGWESNVIRGGTANDYRPVQWSVALPAGAGDLAAPQPVPETQSQSFRREAPRFGDWHLSTSPGGGYGYANAVLDIKEGDRTAASIARGAADGYVHWAFTFTPDGQTAISGGGGGHLVAYDRQGNPLGEFVGHEGDVWAVAVSPDGRLLLSGGSDQTVRLWNVATREPIATLFQATDSDWAIYLPQGYFAASGNAARLITWQVNKGHGRAPCVLSGEGLNKRMNRPALVARAIELASATAAIAELPPEGREDLFAARTDCASAFRNLRPDPAAPVTADGAALAFPVEPNVLPLQSLSVFATSFNGEARPALAVQAVSPEGFAARALDLPLFTGANEIALSVENKAGLDPPIHDDLYRQGDGVLVTGSLNVLAKSFAVQALDLPFFTGANEIALPAGNKAGLDPPIPHDLYRQGDGALVTGAPNVLATGVNRYPDTVSLNPGLRLAFKTEAPGAIAFDWAIEPAKDAIGTAVQGLLDSAKNDMVVAFICFALTIVGAASTAILCFRLTSKRRSPPSRTKAEILLDRRKPWTG
jgi:hypothetical protein